MTETDPEGTADAEEEIDDNGGSQNEGADEKGETKGKEELYDDEDDAEGDIDYECMDRLNKGKDDDKVYAEGDIL